MPVTLYTPIVGDGIRDTNYFQGRVLTAEDLANDQDGDRRRRAQLGRAIGPGVVSGLEARVEVAGPSPVISVEPGLAITAEGGTIALDQKVSLALFGEIETSASEGGVFGPCRAAGPGIDLSGDGAYVLLLSPASAYRERAPRVGLGSDGIAGACGARWRVEGATLRLAALPLSGRADIGADFDAIAALDDPSSVATAEQTRRIVSRFRNHLAHICLPDAAAAWAAPALQAGSPPVFDAPSSILADLAAGSDAPIAACDVPLAVFYVDLFGLRFVDRWAARRLARPTIPAGALSLLPAHGLERLLQFQEHLDEVAEAAPSPSSVRIGDYFRFVPPAGWFPASGASVAGFSPTQFLGAHAGGTSGRVSAGQAADLVDRSLRHRPVDLATGSCLLVHDVDENLSALASGAAARRVRLFTARAINGPLARDSLAVSLEGAWSAARALGRRLAEITVAVQTAAQRRRVDAAVVAMGDVANRYAAVAMARGLDGRDALSVLDGLLAQERELANALMAMVYVGPTGSPVTQPALMVNIARVIFAQGLLARLNTAIPETGGPGLAPAIASGDVCAAAAAQEAIDDYIGQFTGEGGATGPASLGFVASPQGQVVIPGGDEFPHVYEIVNGADRRLTFQLEASVEAADGDWGEATRITDQTGVAITELGVDSGQTGRFEVRVAAPADAVEGQQATLAVRAFSPPPDLRDLSAEALELTVGDEAGDPVAQSVSIPEPADPVLAQVIAPGGTRNFQFTLLYRADEGPSVAQFEIAVVLTGQIEGWLVSIGDALGTPAASPGRFAETIALTAGVRTPVPVTVLAPTAAGRTAQMRLELTSLTSPQIPQTLSAVSPPDGARFVLTNSVS